MIKELLIDNYSNVFKLIPSIMTFVSLFCNDAHAINLSSFFSLKQYCNRKR